MSTISTRIAKLTALLVETQRGERIADDHLTTVIRGYRMSTATWNGLTPEDRHLTRIIAVQHRAVGAPVFSGLSAAVLHGLPLYIGHGASDPRVHLTSASENGSGRGADWVVRHRAPIPVAEVMEICGLRCTTPDRTLLDLARFEAAETALVCADAYLRWEFRVERYIDRARFDSWRDETFAELAAKPGERGVARAREVLKLADPRIDSPLESVSHLYLRRLGFDVELQVPVPSPNGGMYFVDFGFRGLGIFGECDGKVKYLDDRLRGGESADEIVYREKRRHDWITGTTRNGMIRWGWSEVATIHRFARHLEALGLTIPCLPLSRR